MPHSPEKGSIRSVIDGFINSTTFDQQIGQIYDAWNEIGYDSETMRELESSTVEFIIRPFKENLRNRVNYAEGELSRMRATVHDCSERVQTISEELSLAPFKIDHNLPLIEQARILTEKAEILREKRDERMALLRELLQTNHTLCLLLGHTPHTVDPEKVPSEVELATFSAANAKLKREQDARLKRLHDLKREIHSLLTDLERKPTTPLELDLFIEKEEHFILTDDSLHGVAMAKEELFSAKLRLVEECKQLRDKCLAIRNRLKMEATELPECLFPTCKICPSTRNKLAAELAELEKLKIQNLKRFITELREEMNVMHEKCFFSAEDRKPFEEIGSKTVFDEDSLVRHEAECERLRAYYRQNAEFFTKVNRREEVWKKKIELDEKESDPNRFNNRGGQMLRDQQEKAKVEHELKKLDTELIQKAELWAKEKGAPFRVFGQDYIPFLTSQKIAYEEKRERDKEERKKAKDTSAPVAGKRKQENIPQKESAKIAKTGGGAASIGVMGMVPRSPAPVRTADRNHD